MSFAQDPSLAARELAAAIGDPEAALTLFFCSNRYALEQLGRALRESFPAGLLVGCTTAGEITPLGHADGALVGVSFSSRAFRAVSVRIDDLHGFELSKGDRLADEVLSSMMKASGQAARPRGESCFGFLLSDGLSMQEELLVTSIYRNLGDIQLFGGSAGDGISFRQTFVYHEGQFRTDCAVFTLIESALPFRLFKTEHFEASQQKMMVTEADVTRRIVTEINGEPAGRVYARIVGLDVNRLDLEAIPFDLRELVEDTVDVASGGAHSKGLDIVCRFPRGFPARVVGDPNRLRQVLTSLIGNAVKFTDQGHVCVRVLEPSEALPLADDAPAQRPQAAGLAAPASAASAAGPTVLYRIEVEDTGVGIAADAQPRLFQASTQADGATTRRHGGTGLGLAIARQLCELMGGEMGVYSETGRGACFWFTVRLQRDGQGPRSLSPPSRGRRALVVSSSEVVRSALVSQLEDQGWLADAAPPSSLAALSADQGFDLCFTDHPPLAYSGASAGATGQPFVPIVRLHRLERAPPEASWIAGELALPVRRQHLVELLQRLARQSRAPAPAPRGEVLAEHVLEQLRVLDRPGRPKIIVRLIDEFMRTVPARMVAMSAASERNDVAEIRRFAHSLTSVAGNLGALSLSQLARRLDAGVEALDHRGRAAAVALLRTEYERVLEALGSLRQREAGEAPCRIC